MPWAPVNGINLYYEVHGSGPYILFAHGQGGNHLSWWQQVPFFARYYTCITYDHRAFGLSADTDNQGRLAFGSDAIALLDYLGVEDVRVVAHSMGGRSGLPVALHATERTRAVVFAGTNGGVTSETIREQQRAAAAARGDRGLGAFSVAPHFRETHPEHEHLLKAIARMNPPRPRDFLHTPAPPERQTPGRVAERLAATGIPVLFIVGEHDMITPPPLIELCHRLIPNSRFHIVPGSGHSAYFEKPQHFNEVVLSFLRDVDAAANSAK